MIDIILHGSSGRMSQVLASVADSDPDIRIVAGIYNVTRIQNNCFPIYNSLDECKAEASVIIDFSSPNAIQKLLQSACKRKLPLVIATTGLTPEDLKAIKSASEVIPILRSANMSLGVNLMYELSKKAALFLNDKFDIEIIEKHHNQKADSPSGTAYALADAINEVFLNSRSYVYGRNSKFQKRSANEIGIHAIRAGTINGEHSVLFAGKDEILTITHTVYSRQIFALGAITAAKYLVNKSPGLYGFKDMLAEHSAVTNLNVIDGQALITINHIPYDPQAVADIFTALGKENINIDMISQTAPSNGVVDLSFTLPLNLLHRAMDKIYALKKDVPSLSPIAYDNVSKLMLEGVGMEIQSGIAARIFDVLAKLNIPIRTITTSETKISCVIEKADTILAVKAIRDEFNL